MKTNKLLIGALSAVLLMSWSCARLENFKIDSPSDLDERISQYKEEQAALDVVPDGAVEIEITKKMVGKEDNTSVFNDKATMSQYFTIPVGQKLVVRFDNYGSGAARWNSWNIFVTTPYERDEDGFEEIFFLRGDAAVRLNGSTWVGGSVLTMNGEPLEDTDEWWATFTSKMNGALVEAVIDHASEGMAYLDVTSTCADGTVYNIKYNYAVSNRYDINVYLAPDASHQVMRKAYMLASDYPFVPDSNPKSIEVFGFPGPIEKDANLDAVLAASSLVAKVTFEDGSEEEVDPANVKFSVADNFAKELGVDVIMYTYDRTKKGFDGAPIITGFTKVIIGAAVENIEVEPVTAYVMGEATHITLAPISMKVKCNYKDGSSEYLAANLFTIENPVQEAVIGTHTEAFTVKYVSAAGVEFTAKGDLTIVASALQAPSGNVGAADNSTAWWSVFTQDWVVAPGTSQSISFVLGSKAAQIHQGAAVILRRADKNEYGVFRMDNYAWHYTENTNEHLAQLGWILDHNWEDLTPNLNGIKMTVTVSNYDGFASIRSRYEYANGKVYYQYYDNIAVDSNDFQFAFVVDNSHMEFPVDPNVPTSINVTNPPTHTEYYLYDSPISLSTEGLEVTANYSDKDPSVIPISNLTIGKVEATTGEQNVEISYKGISTTVKVNVKLGNAAFGKTDFSNGWWQTFYPNEGVTQVPSGETVTLQMFNYSQATDNKMHPVVVLTKAGASYEYLAVRMDNFGWGAHDEGAAYNACVKDSNWNWDVFAASLHHCKITISISNKGDDKADIRYDATYANGETHFQTYTDIPVEKNNVYYKLVNENSYTVLY